MTTPPRKKQIRKRVGTRLPSVSAAAPPGNVRAGLIDELLADVTKKPSKGKSEPEPTPEEEPFAQKQGAVIRRTRKNRVYPWDEIKSMYVEGQEAEDGTVTFMTLGEVAKKFGFPENRIREKSAEQRWTDQRAVYQRQAMKNIQDARMRKLTDEAIVVDGGALSGSKMGIQLINARLGEIAADVMSHKKVREEIEQQRAMGLPVDKIYSPVYHLEMMNLARALETFLSVAHSALGEDVSRHEVTFPEGIQVDITAEMTRDEPERLAALLEAAAMTRIFEGMGIDGSEEEWDDQEQLALEDGEIQEAEIVEDGEDE